MTPTPQKTLKPMLGVSAVGLAVGLTSAFATIGFVELVLFLNRLFYVSAGSRAELQGTTLALVTIAALTLGGLAVGLIMRYGVTSRENIGPADTIFAVQLHERLPSPVSGTSSTIAAILSLGCGASVGQYGPLVYLGTLVGQLASRLSLRLGDIRTIAIACGVAAAISAAFNAPIAALLFTHEVILRHYSLRMFTAVTIASACGYLVANVIFHHPPLFLIDFTGNLRGAEFLLFAVEGISCGLLAVAFMRLLQQCAGLARRIAIPAACKPMAAGFVVSLIALQVPEVLGAGQEVFRLASAGGHYAAETLLLILVVKLLVTVLCIGFGFAGGVIFPALLIGVLFGALFAEVVPQTLLASYSGIPVYAICGMVALVSPVIGAPMTAVLLVFEFTRNYEITIAAMVAIVFANLIAHRWTRGSLYDFQLFCRGIDLSQGREQAYLMHHKVSEYLTQSLPVKVESASIAELRQTLSATELGSVVITDADGHFRGLLFPHQLHDADDEAVAASLALESGLKFDRDTSLWEAMQHMREFIGDAVPVVDSESGRYLGAMPEAVVIQVYLDATQKLRREQHEA